MVNNKEGKNEATLGDVVDALENVHDKLDEILVWQKISGSAKVRELLISALGTPEKKLVYHLSDGKSTKEIVDASKVSAGAISGYWKSWKNLGLMRIQKVTGGERSIRIFDLTDFGIEVPKNINKTKESVPADSQTVLATNVVPDSIEGAETK